MTLKKSLKYVAAAAALAGCVLLGSAAKSNLYNLGKQVEILVNMMRTLSLFYVDDVEPDKIMDAAAKGMTKILDPYTEYFSPEEMESFDVMTTGKYGGVGSIIRMRGEYVEFFGPYKNSPAYRAGIRAGDIILEIDGEDAKGMTTQQVSDRLKGDPGTSVRLTVGKFPDNRPQRVRITRERIAIPGVPYHAMLNESVGYILHDDFTEGCAAEFLRAYRDLENKGMKALVLDYRNNTGGILQEAVSILSYFLPAGSEVVSMRSSKDHNENTKFVTENPPIAPNIPLVVLVDSDTASAAEIVAGALQDNDRAVVIGRRTYGKGLVQSTFPLGHDAYAKVTTSKYHLPSGRCIQAIEYGAHNADGSVSSVPDSLITEFRTKAGRKVYDGCGVMPDIKLPTEYISTFSVVVYAQGFVDDFVSDYTRQHYGELEGNVTPVKYRFSDEAYAEFVKWMEGKEVAWDSMANRYWAEFEKIAANEPWGEDIKEQMATIKQTLTKDTEDYLWMYKKELQEAIESSIIKRYCFDEGITAHLLPSDKDVKEALEVLADSENYHRILSSQDTTRN